jgi:hypothetical protein
VARVHALGPVVDLALLLVEPGDLRRRASRPRPRSPRVRSAARRPGPRRSTNAICTSSRSRRAASRASPSETSGWLWSSESIFVASSASRRRS